MKAYDENDDIGKKTALRPSITVTIYHLRILFVLIRGPAKAKRIFLKQAD